MPSPNQRPHRWNLYHDVGLRLIYHHTPDPAVDVTVDTARITGLNGSEATTLAPITTHRNL